MKKILLIIVVLALLLTGCKFGKTYDEIDYEQYTHMIEKKDSFILFIGSSECSHCIAYKKTLAKVIKEYDVDVKYLDLSKMSDKENNEFKSKISFTGTPTTIFIEKGEEKSHYNRIVGAQDYEKVVEKFKDNGYVEVK